MLQENVMKVGSERVVSNELVNNQVFTYEKHKANSRKLAKLKNNRDFSSVNVKNLKKSIKEIGVHQPIRVIKADYVVANKYEIVDFITGNEIPKDEIKKYDVVIDGQHRIQAYLEIIEEDENFDKPLIFLYMILGEDDDLLNVLSEINNTVRSWGGKDLVGAVEMKLKGKYLLITKINELTDKGYSLDAACKILTFGNAINKSILNKVTKREKLSEKVLEQISFTSGIERGENILKAAKIHLAEKSLQTRTIIDWIIGKYNLLGDEDKVTFETNMCSFFSNLDEDTADGIDNARGKRGVVTKQEIIYNLLNDNYKVFLENKRETIQKVA